MTVTVVIATIDRAEDLRITLEDWRKGTVLPTEIRVVDASDNNETETICRQSWEPLTVTYMRSVVKSAAKQRNAGAEGCETDLIAFCDDDIELPSDALEKLIEVFERDPEGQIGGVAGVIIGLHHKPPGRLLKKYYRIQAGYYHEHYGGRFFGAGINILPTERAEDPELYPSQWLNGGVVVYRAELFSREQFPEFSGYSFQEDANLSARIGRTHKLYFHRGVRYIHKGSPGQYKSNARKLAAMQIVHRWHNAKSLLGLKGFELWWKFWLSLVFESLLLLRNRPMQWRESLAGRWSAWWRLAILRQSPESLLSNL